MIVRSGRIRLVGGLFHNEFLDCMWTPILDIPKPRGPFLVVPAETVISRTKLEVERYQLCMYMTKLGTFFFEYIHSSLNPISAEVLLERFHPGFEVDLSKLTRSWTA